MISSYNLKQFFSFFFHFYNFEKELSESLCGIDHTVLPDVTQQRPNPKCSTNKAPYMSSGYPDSSRLTF